MAKSYKVTVFAGNKVVADMAQQVKNATIEASIQIKTLKGGATSATATVLAPGPAGSNRKMEDVEGWFVNGTADEVPVAVGEPWEAEAGNKNTNWWDGIAGTWSLGSSVPLPKTEVSNSFGQRSDVSISEKKFTDELKVDVENINSLTGYGLGKSHTFAIGETGYQERIGVRFPAGFISKKIKIKISSTKDLVCQLFWQRNSNPVVNLIPQFYISWQNIGGLFVFESEIEASDLSIASNLFLFIQNNTAFAEAVTISFDSITYTRSVKEDVSKNKSDLETANSNISNLSQSLSTTNSQVSDLNTSMSKIDEALQTEDQQTDIKNLADKQQLVIEQGSIMANRMDWHINSANMLKSGDIIKVRFISINGANQPFNRFYKYNNTKVADIVWTLDSASGKYKSQVFEVPITQSDIDTYPDYRLILQTSNSAGLNADTITIDYSYIFRKGAYVDVKEMDIQVGQYSGAFEMAYKRYDRMKKIVVKKLGGDFSTIQDAINSVTDASATNQYDIQVWDDYDITNLTDLYVVGTPLVKNTNADPAVPVALVITKNWVNIRGMGGRRRLTIVSPTSLASNSFQYVQVIYPKGNVVIDNFDIIIKGGRYAIHQESGGVVDHPDYFATTVYRNLYVEHLGNKPEDGYNSAWGAPWAQANGTSAGGKQVYENVTWKSVGRTPFYVHSNKDFVSGNELHLINCTAIGGNEFNLNDFSVHFQDLGSGQKSLTNIVGCNFKRFNILNEIRGLEQTMTSADLWQNGGAYLNGQNNVPMLANVSIGNVLKFSSINNNHDIEVIGGTAKELIFGNTLRTFKSSANAKGETWGSKRLVQSASGSTQIFSLPYRVGDCATSSKTLIIRVNGVDYTITFDKNYMTSAGTSYAWNTVPYLSQTDIVNEINAAFPTIFRVDIGFGYDMYSFKDCMEVGYNGSGVTIDRFKFLCRDYNFNNGWKLAQAGDRIEGISSNRLDIGTTENILLVNKVLIPASRVGLSGVIAGNFYKSGANGNLVLASLADGQFVSIDAFTLKYL